MTMKNIVNKTNISFDNIIGDENQESFIQMKTSNISESNINGNMRNWPMPEYLTTDNCYNQDPIGDVETV